MSDDAARIYISQKTDVDKNFGIVPGSVGNLEAKSAIAAKADSIRIIGRMGIKLVTGTDQKDSAGTDLSAVYGLDLIAGNADEKYTPTGFPIWTAFSTMASTTTIDVYVCFLLTTHDANIFVFV